MSSLVASFKGIIANDRNISVDRAFILLRKHANDRNASLRAVAGAVVTLGPRP